MMELNSIQRLLSIAEQTKLKELIQVPGGDKQIENFREEIDHLSIDKKETAYSLFLTKDNEIPTLSNQLKMVYMILFEDIKIPPALREKMKAVASTTELQSRYPIIFQMAFILGLVLGLFPLLLKGANKAWLKWSDEAFGLIEFWVALGLIAIIIIARITYWKYKVKYNPIFLQQKRQQDESAHMIYEKNKVSKLKKQV